MRMVEISTWISTHRWLFSLREPQVDMKTPGDSRISKSAGKCLKPRIVKIPEHHQRALKGDVREYALYSAAHTAGF